MEAITVLESLSASVGRYDTLINDFQNAELAGVLRINRTFFLELHNEIATTFGYPVKQ